MTSAAAGGFPLRLARGHRKFRRRRYSPDQYASLAAGQRPTALVIGCIDSRVAPEVVFDAQAGEMLVVRNIANLVPPYRPDAEYHGTSAAIEFAVRVLEVRHVVVLGHEACGGIEAFRRSVRGEADGSATDFVARWMDIARPAVALADAEAPGADAPNGGQEAMERAGIRQSLRNLRTFPWLAERERASSLALHGARFRIAEGLVEVLDEASGRFVPLDTGPRLRRVIG